MDFTAFVCLYQRQAKVKDFVPVMCSCGVCKCHIAGVCSEDGVQTSSVQHDARGAVIL